MEHKQKSPKGDSHISRPSEEDTPPNFAPFCEELEVKLSLIPNSFDFFAHVHVNMRSRVEVRACVYVRRVGNFTHAQIAILANSHSVPLKKCETFT